MTLPWVFDGLTLGLAIATGAAWWQGLRQRRLRRQLEVGSPDVLWFWDVGTERLRISDRVWDWTDRLPGGLKELVDRRHEFIADADFERLRSAGREVVAGRSRGLDLDVPIRFPGQPERWFRVRGLVVRGGRRPRFAGSLSEVTEFRRLGEQLWRWSHLDQLTGLFNRSHLMEALGGLTGPHSLLLIDIDHFTAINEAFRHSGGDDVLRWMAQILPRLFREGDLVARWGSDKFVVVGPTRVEGREARIHHKLSTSTGPVPWSLSVSVGIVAWDGPFEASELMTRAFQALQRAQSLGGGRSVVFDPSIAAEAERKAELEKALVRALRDGGLRLVYQPQYRVSDGALTGFEALARWNHPEFGEVSPTEFIPLAEALGAIGELGGWALRSACAFLSSLGSHGRLLTVSVNVSALQFRDPGFVDLAGSIVKEGGVNPSNIELELTESVLVNAADDVFQRLNLLRQRGFRIALDDFGKGYSSLSYLRFMPLDTLKIDRDFLVDPGQEALLGGIVHLGRILRLQVIAEGVEEESQLTVLRDHGCDKVQGFLLSRPLEVRDAEAAARRATSSY